MKLPDKIIKHRKENGWSQEDFAEKLNVSRQAVSRWENGTALPDAQNILQISKLFHVTTDYLLDYHNDKKYGEQVDELLRIFSSLTNEQKELYIEQGKAFLRINFKRNSELSNAISKKNNNVV